MPSCPILNAFHVRVTVHSFSRESNFMHEPWPSVICLACARSDRKLQSSPSHATVHPLSVFSRKSSFNQRCTTSRRPWNAGQHVSSSTDTMATPSWDTLVQDSERLRAEVRDRLLLALLPFTSASF